MIAASDSASKASVKSFAHASNKSSDSSPFATLLAATTQQSSQKQQVSAPDKSDAASPKPPAQVDEAQAGAAQTNTTQATPSPTRSDDRRDKKSDKDHSDQNDDADTDAPAQALVPAASTPVAAPVAVPPTMQVNPQTFDITLAAAKPNSDPSQAVPTGSDASKVDPKGPQAQPVNDNVPAVQAPAPPQIQTADDDINTPIGTPPPVTVAVTIQNRADDSKPAPGKAAAAKPVAADQPEMAQNPAPATDANTVAQMIMTAAPAASGSVAVNTTSDTAAATQIAGIAATATNKPSSSDAAPAAKSPQLASDTADTSAAVPVPGSPTATTVPVATSGKDAAKDSGKSNADAKPVHVADAQPPSDMPAPAPQAIPAPAMPPHIAVNAFGIAAPVTAAAGNGMVTSSVQVTLADSDPTPDMDALAVSVAARAMSGAKQFEIRLDPPELGRVDVRLSIDASGKTQAHMTADQPQTLDLLQKDATTLTQALRDAGLDVSQSGLNFSLRGQDRQNDDGNNGAGQGRRTNLIATRAIQAVQSPGVISFNGAAADARVDIHV
ncbi:MAG: flagellar hook-length control protein FliK [Rhizomicrobium sp.]